MRDQIIPVFFDEKSATSAQYTNTIQGIRAAAARYNSRLCLISDAQLDDTDFHALLPVAILTSTSMPFLQDVIARLRSAGRHAVLAGTDSEQFGHDVSCATPSRRAETQQLVNYLYKCGKERVALMGFGQNSINDTFRFHAAMSAMAAWGKMLTDHDVWLWQSDPKASFDSFFPVASRYDAVICPNDIIAVCFAESCKAHGLRVPEDLFIASFGNTLVGKYARPSITTMTMDMLYVGEQAFNVWHFLMTNEAAQSSAIKITVPSRILVRESTANIHMEAGEGAVTPALKADRFYSMPNVRELVAIDSCITQRDEIDMAIIRSLFNGTSYECISDELFISGSTLRYRLNKIFADAGVKNRQDFETLIHTYLGEGNPFSERDG